MDDGEEVELKEKGSRFIGQAFAVADESEAQERLEACRKRYHSARHHCSAWRLQPPERPRERSDDDGEPNATAGPPILTAIQQTGLVDLLVVVTRYFGGTKLGRGGLVRAYGDSARLALEAAPRRRVWRELALSCRCSYEDLGLVEAILSRESERLRSCERDFAESPCFRIRVLVSDAEPLRAQLVEACAGRAQVSVEEL